MKKCWDLDLLKRPKTSELKIIFENWQGKCCNIRYGIADEEVRNHLEAIRDEQLRKDMEEFRMAEKALKEKINNSKVDSSKPITKSHPQAYHTSRLLGFTKQLNDILEKEIYGHKEDIIVETCETGGIQSIGKYFHFFLKQKIQKFNIYNIFIFYLLIEVLNLTEEDISEYFILIFINFVIIN